MVLKRLLDKIRTPGSLTANFFSLASASLVVLLIQILFTPLLSRIYTPTAYGVFAVYSALLNSLITIGTLGMKGAVMLPKGKFSFLNLIRLNFVFITITFLLNSVIMIAVGPEIVSLLQANQLRNVVFFIPLLATMASVIEILAGWHIKSGDFKTGPITRVVSNLISRAIGVGYGLEISNIWHGLFYGDIISRCFSLCIFLRKKFWRMIRILSVGFNRQKVKIVFFKYKDFLVYNFPSSVVASLAGQLPVYLTGICFGSQYVGYLGFAISLLYIPLNLIGNSMYTVFYQKVAQIGDENLPEIANLTRGVIDNLIHISFVPFVILIGFGDYIFGWVLGQDWIDSGNIARGLGLHYLMFLLYTAVSPVFNILKLQKKHFQTKIMHLGFGLIAFGIGYVHDDALLAFFIYGILGSIPYGIAIITILKRLKLPIAPFLLRMLIVLVSLVVVWGIRIFISQDASTGI